ncbi:16S rRNA (cytidine(1402)-2'-O)-methyltransferase [Roseibacterium sp. SDUM158016]|uniref:16S rRNA (cytidine(1402)-2'-O)-methyltransferase n=1 Tax=Roseicyclus sediminis TaxID=2980997 RepID=UPI0021D03E82|nr:16S rRNA (cytidine(1402)-2'-O)-methyltransferase [Roseibacterium sp. SDUM158016]MCU4654407.1 16S rRNA (cytidine(1402)-2'-O)-methyltransferase [Roseibacterium sp. SDUM158016]
MAQSDGKTRRDAQGADGGAPPVSAAALAPGLHFVATPIGTARDITLRALDTLREADAIAAEDTRSARRLMELHGVPVAGRPILPYHDHNGPAMRPRLIAMLKEGLRVAYVSDAGTPLVADPGYQLARAAIEAGIPITAAPGPSAVLAALTVSGLPSDRFLFAGFPPTQAGARKAWLADLDAAGGTVILFESPKRVHRLLGELCEVLGDERPAALCRELTKRFEDVRRGSLGTLRDAVADDPPRGECVLVLDRAPAVRASDDVLEDELRAALTRLSVKAAAAEVSERLGLPRREVYQAALRLKEESGDEQVRDGRAGGR